MADRVAPGVRIGGAARIGDEPVFSGLDLTLVAGGWTCLLGPSGVGKTTVLRLLAGLPTGVRFDGRIETRDGAPLAGRVALMAQDALLMPWRTVLGNVMLGADLRGERPDPARGREMLARVGLEDRAGDWPEGLSGGERQRVALARTLMEDRMLVLLDEPFSALDAKTRGEMQDMTAGVLAGRTVLLVTHDPAEAARLGQRIVVMTGAGQHEEPAPDGPVPRPEGDAGVLAAQAALLAALRAAP